jgi:YHS domain-containing protein
MNVPVHNHPVSRSQNRDPVCGMEVDPSKGAASVPYQGTTFYFCSQGCAATYGQHRKITRRVIRIHLTPRRMRRSRSKANTLVQCIRRSNKQFRATAQSVA